MSEQVEPLYFDDVFELAEAKWPYMTTALTRCADINNEKSVEDFIHNIRLIAQADANEWHLKQLEYRAYLDSGKWKVKATEIKELFGNRCALCNSSENLNAHHRTYERLYHEEISDLICLCRNCHAKFHGKEQQ